MHATIPALPDGIHYILKSGIQLGEADGSLDGLLDRMEGTLLATGMAALISLFGISQLYFEAPPFTTVIKELLVGLLIANLMTLFCHRHHEELALRGTLPGWSWSSASLMISVVYLWQHWSHATARMVGSGWL